MKRSYPVSVGILFFIAIILVSFFAIYSENDTEGEIRVAFFPNISHAIPIVGLENEIFQNQIGNKTKIKQMLFDSGPQVIESMLSGQVDLAYVGPGPSINGFLKSDKKIKILSGAASGGASFIVHPKSSINSVVDFDGKKIAAPQIGNSQDISLRTFLGEHGLKAAEKGGTIVVYNISLPEIYTLFAKGDIDAAWVPEPTATLLVKQLEGKRLFFEEDLWEDNKFTSVLLIVRQDFLEKNPTIINDWLKSHKETISWINKNPLETRVIFNNFLQDHLGKTIPNEIIDEALSHIEITNDPVPESVKIFAQRADKLGYLGHSGYDLDGIFVDINSNAQNYEGRLG